MLRINNKYNIKHSSSLSIVILILCLSSLICGCAAVNHGNLARSQKVTREFETFQIFADHRYYYLNQENDPYAVVALQNDYQIADPMWRELDPKSETFKKVIGSAELQLPGTDQPIIEIHQVLTEENPGINHIAFRCEDIKETYQELSDKGIEFDKEPHEVSHTGRTNFLLRNPDGWRLQITDKTRREPEREKS